MKKKNKKPTPKLTPMTLATFFFAASIMLFIGVVGSAYIGRSYAVQTIANVPESLTVHSDQWTRYNDGQTYETGVTLINGLTLYSDFYGTDGTGKTYELYCLEHKKGMPSNGTYNKDGTLNTKYINKGIVYIVSNAYPYNASFMADEPWPVRKYVTQWAIWYYQDLVNNVQPNAEGELSADEKSKIQGNQKYGTKIIQLAQQALADNAVQDAEDALNVDKNAITYEISSDGKYLESNYIPVVGSNTRYRGYTVSLSENSYDAKIVTEEGTEVPNGTSFTTGAKFKIRVPLEKLKEVNQIDLTATIKGKFEHREVYAYKHSTGDSAQTALVPAFDTVEKETNLELQFNIPTGKVQISKQDITNSEEVAGATLVITDCTGREVARWVSTTEPHYIEALPVSTDNCKYRLTEVLAPEGYELSSSTVEFEVKADGSVSSVVMTNTPLTPTPDTGMNIPLIVYIVGGLVLLCGVAIVYESTKTRKQN